MYRNLNLKKLVFTGGNVTSERRRIRKTRRCGAFTLLLALVFATAMLLHTPVVRAVQTSVASDAITFALCQISSDIVNRAMLIVGLDISDEFKITSATFIEGPAAGAARLVGTVYNGSGVEFAVDLVLEDRLDPGDTGYSDACRIVKINPGCTQADPDSWHVYTTLNGTLTGLPGSIFDGAVYNVTLRDTGSACTDAAQVGKGANTHNIQHGVFAPLEFVLANPEAYSSLSAYPFNGKLSIIILNIDKDPADIVDSYDHRDDLLYLRQDNFPVPSPDLTGTWEGVIECAGMLDFADVETFSSPMTLKVGPPSGFNYSVELSDAGGNVVATYCAEYTDDPRGGQINNGRMTNSDTGQPLVLLKVRKDDLGNVTLKAREFSIIPDGQGDTDLESDGLDFCKWTFTQTSTDDPGIEPVCP